MKRAFQIGLLVGLLALLTSSAAAAAACPAQPTNSDGTTITNPGPDQVVTSPFTISGQYFGSFEGVVPIHILDAGGGVLLDVNAMNECCKLAPYEREVTFTVQAATPACIVIYRESGADGSLTPLAQVPVTLAPAMRLPGTGSATLPPLPLVIVIALALASAGILLRRRILLHR
jgi:hypothetical protein